MHTPAQARLSIPRIAAAVLAALMLVPLSIAGTVAYVKWAATDTLTEIAERTAPHTRCDPPTEHEVLHVTITPRAGHFAIGCVYYGPRGAYRRKGA